MVLLVRVEQVNGRPMEPEILTEATFKELCSYYNPPPLTPHIHHMQLKSLVRMKFV